MALNNEFKVKNDLNTLGRILSGGTDLTTIFSPSNTSWTLSANNGTFGVAGGDTLSVQGGNGVDVRVATGTDTVRVSGIDATTSVKGVASFSSDNFAVTNGVVTVKNGGIVNAELATASSSNLANNVVVRGASGEFSSGTITVAGNVSASGIVYGSGSNSQQWGNVFTAYTNTSSTFATNTLLQSTSALLTPITTTRALTGQLVLNTDFNNYRTSVATSTATLLPTTIYQNASGNWQSTFTNVQSNSANWNSTYTTVQATSALTSSVTTDLSVGGISAAQVLPVGTTFQDFVEQLFVKTFFPTYIAPSITNVSSSIGTSVEAGTTGLTVTVTFLSGSINGQTVGGIWNPSLAQNTRSGLLTGGQIFGTQINSRTTNNTIAATSASRVIVDNNNIFSVRADYEQGPQPKDSRGDNFETPLPAGSVTSSVTVVGRRNGFFGAETGPTGAPTTSSVIRALSTSQLNPAVNTSYTINIPEGATRITFAYPASLGLANGSGIEPAFKDMTNNFDYTSEFGSPTTVNVEGANGFTAISYYVYSYTPAVPIPGAFSLRLII